MGGDLELSLGGVELTIRGWRGVTTLLAAVLVAAAILQQLRLPAEQRTWHGMLFGFVPYEFRPPTVRRLTETVWNPEQRAVVVPTVFGVGWTVNAAALVRALSGSSGETSE